MQTVAVYYEPKVKTYGFNNLKNLTLLRLRASLDNISAWLEQVDFLSDSNLKYFFAVVQNTDGKDVSVSLLFRSDHVDEVLQILSEKFEVNPDTMDVVRQVELIFFQGPHFGDRWGIAKNAFEALEKKQIKALVAGCSGAAIYLVFQQGEVDKAISCLKEVFQTP